MKKIQLWTTVFCTLMIITQPAFAVLQEGSSGKDYSIIRTTGPNTLQVKLVDHGAGTTSTVASDNTGNGCNTPTPYVQIKDGTTCATHTYATSCLASYSNLTLEGENYAYLKTTTNYDCADLI